jgi:hypothetical protein
MVQAAEMNQPGGVSGDWLRDLYQLELFICGYIKPLDI